MNKNLNFTGALALVALGLSGMLSGGCGRWNVDEPSNYLDFMEEALQSGSPTVMPPWTNLSQHTTGGSDFHPDISSDGKWIVFASDRHHPLPDIYVKRTDGAAVQRRTSDEHADDYPKFSNAANGPRRIAFASNRDGRWNIYIINMEGDTGVVQHVTEDERWDNIAPCWSPDDKLLAFCTRKGEGEAWIIRVKNLETNEISEIGSGLFPDWSIDWKIAFQKARSGHGNWYDVYTVQWNERNGAVSNPTVIVSGEDYACINPAWSDDGRYLAYATVHRSPYSKQMERVQQADDIFVIAGDGSGAAIQVTNHPASDWAPTWHPDMNDGRLFFCSSRDETQTIWSVIPFHPDKDLEPRVLDGAGLVH
ncbi:MAG: DPP IV N-terminal domain-containing protein [Planctomycetes bacterium]|nr:DPP IV N-terminal domain-containing protein [Planctomycetota bacterium]